MASNQRIATDRRRTGGTQAKDWHMGIAGSLAAQTIYDERIAADTLVKRCIAEAPLAVGALAIATGERFWLVAVAAVSPLFPHRYFVVVCREGEYQCSRELPRVAAVAIELVKQHRLHRKAAATSQMAAAS